MGRDFWVLARDPTVGVPLSETGSLRAFTMEGRYIYQIPTIVVVYDYDDTRITIQTARFTKARVGEAGTA